jgi:hypothetical protein
MPTLKKWLLDQRLAVPSEAEIEARKQQFLARAQQQLAQSYQNAMSQGYQGVHGLQAQQAMQAQAQHAMQAQAFAQQSPMVSHSPINFKVTDKITECTRQLPMALAAKIHMIAFYTDPYRFVVVFKDKPEMIPQKLVFDDVDDFPSDAHIARIALECP